MKQKKKDEIFKYRKIAKSRVDISTTTTTTTRTYSRE